MIEFTVKVKTDDATYRKKFLIHDSIRFDPDDPEVKRCIEEALGDVKGVPEDVVISAKMEV